MSESEYANIGKNECRKRQASGIAALGLTVILSVAFVLGKVEWYWFLVLLLPSWGAMEGALQVKEKT